MFFDEFTSAAQIKAPKAISKTFVPFLDVYVAQDIKKTTIVSEKVQTDKNGRKITKKKIPKASCTFVVCGNDKLKETPWLRTNDPKQKILPFFEDEENEDVEGLSDHEKQEREKNHDKGVQIIKHFNMNNYSGPALYLPVITRIPDGKNSKIIYERMVKELPLGCKLVCDVPDSEKEHFRTNAYFRLKGLYCQRSRMKTQAEKEAEKLELESVRNGQSNAAKKQKTETSTKVTATEMGSEESVSAPIDVIEEEPSYFYSICFEDFEEIEIALMSEDERDLRDPTLLIQDTTCQYSRVLDAMCSEVNSKKDDYIYKTLGLDEHGFNEQTVQTPTVSFILPIPAQNISVHPYIVTKKQEISENGEDSNKIQVQMEMDNDDVVVEERKRPKTDVLPLFPTELNVGNHYPIALLGTKFSYDKDNTKKPMLSFRIIKKEPVVSSSHDKNTIQCYYHDMSAAIFRPDEINRLFGIYGPDWEKVALGWMPSVLVELSVKKVERFNSMGVSRNEIRGEDHPLAACFVDDNVQSIRGQILFEQTHVTKMYPLLQKSLQENSYHFSYERHMTRLLALLCDAKIISASTDKIVKSAQGQKTHLYLRNVTTEGWVPAVKNYLALQNNVVNPMNNDPEMGVINHNESPALIKWDGHRQACAVRYPEFDLNDDSWKKDGTYAKMLDCVLCDGIKIKTLDELNLKETTIDRHVPPDYFKTTLSRTELSYYTDLMMYMILIGRICLLLESIPNSGELMMDYHKLLESIENELLEVYDLKKNEEFMKKHIFPSGILLQSILRTTGRFSLYLYSIAAKRREFKPSDEIIAIRSKTTTVPEDFKKTLE